MNNTKKITEVFLEAIYFTFDAVGSLTYGKGSLYKSLKNGPFSEWTDR